jgi:hypothetical protein
VSKLELSLLVEQTGILLIILSIEFCFSAHTHRKYCVIVRAYRKSRKDELRIMDRGEKPQGTLAVSVLRTAPDDQDRKLSSWLRWPQRWLARSQHPWACTIECQTHAKTTNSAHATRNKTARSKSSKSRSKSRRRRQKIDKKKSID